MKVLMVASDRMEFRGILAHAQYAKPVETRADWARVVRLGSNEFIILANGAGMERAAAGAEAALAASRVDALASVGFCGALVPELAIGEIVVATEVTDGELRYSTLPVSSPARHRRGVLRTSSRVVQSVKERQALRASGATVVDMEASAVARCAQSHGLPFYCIKAVTDLSDEELLNDFNKALREDGHFDTIILLKGTIRDPFARMRELLRLRSRSIRAAQALGDFFADCRF